MNKNLKRRTVLRSALCSIAVVSLPLQSIGQVRGVAGSTMTAEQVREQNYSSLILKLNYKVRDLAPAVRFWEILGGTASINGDRALVDIAGVLIELRVSSNVAGSSQDSVVNHVAFRIPSLEPLLATLDAENIEYFDPPQFTGSVQIFSPDGDKVEFFDNTSASPGFDPASSGSLPTEVERHNVPVNGLVSHHLHYYLPEGTDVIAVRNWYLARFGGIPGIRLRYEALDFAAINFNFSVDTTPSYPTAGRSMDSIEFVVTNLEVLARDIEAQGTVLTEAFQRHADGTASAALVEPWGTTIRLTELPA